ncbi:phospholipid-transporting ATPase IA-like [Galendromus occidentalis]|uniref:Phospholipid-transporting ATPase n=1 Tax=Galendromus occidentalis TaxID=34638 RepID=A0AAJ7L477_9ACAR|nr:phospholipid-transporting ATPase IA-like [Galendromus occidentalis]
MQQIPGVSPTGRFATAVPLVIILIVSAIREIFEDFKRHLEDRGVNRSEVKALRRATKDGPAVWVDIMWMKVAVGDFLKITSGNTFPADMILLSSSEPDRMCYVETANLDGETNLKVRQAPKDLPIWMDTRDLGEVSGVVNCEKPNRHLYEFSGNFQLDDEFTERAVPVDNDAILLRGATLKNTSWVFGFVIYTGHESKLMMNSMAPPLKRSTVDKLTNEQIIMMFIILITISLISAIAAEIWIRGNEFLSFIPWRDGTPVNFGFNFLTFTILYNNLIPISLQVTLEGVRYLQAGYINQDIEMYHEATDTPAKARTSNLNEELGAVRYVFSDKTGTLTCNVMKFKRCSIGGQIFGDIETGMDPKEIESILQRKDQLSEQVRSFFTIMALCHTVVVPETDSSTGELAYQASSPDEAALVKGAAEVGFVFTTRKPAECTVEILGEKSTYEILNVIDFTSSRKRMSIVVRTPEGRIILMCKGAETMIFERLSDRNDSSLTDAVLSDLGMFATQGLRTLCFAATEVDSEAYETWRHEYNKASAAILNREEKVAVIADRIEQNLILFGASAIEDRLQDGVPETIADLLRAHIKVWVLTGDKQETAINIGYSMRLLTNDIDLVLINEDTLEATREEIRNCLTERRDPLRHGHPIGVVIDGKTLTHALHEDVLADFVELSLAVKCLICCRVSPIQKAEIVNMVRRETDAITLAIGDGANDVAMIQAAHVGVGISGIEGLQAACSSDYSIAQFRFLRRLLFVHGAWNNARLCKLILFSFHKNVCLYLIEMWFALYSGWSGQTLFERWTIAMYNVLFTALPPLAIGLFDRTCSAVSMMDFPELYRREQHEIDFNKKTFWVWIGNSVYHSLVLYFLSMFMMTQDVAWDNGKDGGYLMLGNMCYTYVVITVCFKAGLEINTWSWPVYAAIWGSIGLWFLVLRIYSNLWPWSPIGAEMAGMDVMVCSSTLFWFGCPFVPAAALLLDLSLIVIRRTTCKTLAMAIREIEIRGPDPVPDSAVFKW